MECSGVRSLYWRSLTAGAATWSVPYYLYTRVCSLKWLNTKEPRALCPGGLYSWWHFASPANGSGSHDCALVTWAYGIPCPAMVSPNAGPGKEDKLLHPDDHLIWCSKVDSGPRSLFQFLVQDPISFITALQRSLGQGNVFTSVCQSFCWQGGGVSVWCPWTETPPICKEWTVHILLECILVFM